LPCAFACAESKSPVPPVKSPEPVVDASVTTSTTEDAASSDSTFEIRRRECVKGPYGPSWKLRPWAQCRRDSDCPLAGSCFGTPDSVCVYDGVEASPTEPCDDGRACVANGIGTCVHYLNSSCQYDSCRTGSDCPDGYACVCPVGHDMHQCVWDGCQDDTSCQDGERCRIDTSIHGPYALMHCTTSADECREDSECAETTGACGYDIDRHLWTCTGIIIVD
jgi:hypothetical protein